MGCHPLKTSPPFADSLETVEWTGKISWNGFGSCCHDVATWYFLTSWCSATMFMAAIKHQEMIHGTQDPCLFLQEHH